MYERNGVNNECTYAFVIEISSAYLFFFNTSINFKKSISSEKVI